MSDQEKKENGLGKLLPQYGIEGFDPNEALTRVVGTNNSGEQVEALYMKYAPAMAWFLTVFPEGCLNHTFNILNNQKATVTASIFRHATDTRPAATATCTRYYDESENGRYYEQNAVTAAYRKALGYLGFGTPIDAHFVEGIPTEQNGSIPEMTDGGVPITPPALPAGFDLNINKEEKPTEPVKRRGRRKKNADAEVPAVKAESKTDDVMVELDDVKETSAVSAEDAPVANDVSVNDTQTALEDFAKATESAVAEKKAAAEPATKPSSSSVTPDAQAASAESKAEEHAMTLEEASKTLVPRGEMRGRTIEEAAKLKGKEFIRWHYDKARMTAPDSPFAKAAEIYCEFYGC